MKRHLPTHPSLDQLKHQAKELLQQTRAGAQEATVRFRDHHPHSGNLESIKLSDAQLVIAREYGFASWPKLKRHIEDLAAVEARIARLRSEFAAGDATARLRLLAKAPNKNRFENYDPNATSLSDADARLLVASEESYAYWSKYESYLHLDPAVKDVIGAARAGNLTVLLKALRLDPEAANPKWVPGFPPPIPVPNDSIPLFCISEGIWRRTNRQNNGYELARALIAAGAEVEAEGGLPLTSAISFNAVRVVEALLDSGAAVDGVDGDGVPMAYAMHFGFTGIGELLAQRGAKLDLRFAAGLGRIELVKSWFNPDGSLKAGAGALADPYGLKAKARGESAFRCERTRENILSQSLFFACVNGKLDVADFLLAQSANINAIVPGLDVRATILHRIASTDSGEYAVIRFLLDRGADRTIRDEEYHATPADWASYFKLDRVVELLESYRPSGGRDSS